MLDRACARGERLWRSLAFGLALAAAAPASGPLHAQNERPLVRLQLQWFHQAQFAGFYVAQALGFYEREGIAVEFIQGGSPVAGAPAIDTLQVLSLGGADVALATISSALVARRGGAQIVNIAQIFQRPGLVLVCRRAVGIHKPSDVRGRTIGVWHGGDEYDLAYWLRRHGIAESDVTIVTQRADGRDLIEGQVDCGTVMAYNDYWTLLRSGFSPASLYIVRFGDEGGILEDGVYANAAALADPARRDRLARFLRASAAGWKHAQQNPEEAVEITRLWAAEANPVHQRRMLDTVLSLVYARPPFGLLDLAAFDVSTRILGQGVGDFAGIAAAARGAWTHDIWLAAGLDAGARARLTPAVRHYFTQAVTSSWFHVLLLLGMASFALSGFMQAVQRRYNIWGAFILAMLPAAGGGTLRDLLIGGDRHPPFIFKDPIYLGLIASVVLLGVCISPLLSDRAPRSRLFERTMILFDTIGFACLTVVGSQVALMAGLGWYWIPFCAGVTCAGGGMLRDIVIGREPRTFQGVLYEEIAVVGGLLLYVLLLFVNRYEHVEWLVTGAILTTMVVVFTARLLVVRYGIRSYRLGRASKSAAG